MPVRREGLTLRQAALVAGFAYLLGPVAYAEFNLYPKLVIAGNIVQTVHNIGAHPSTFAVAVLCYFVDFLEDVVIAWALFYLLAPVNRSLSLLAAWFRIVYAGLALLSTFNLVNVFRLLTTPAQAALFGTRQLDAQVQLLLSSFRHEWGFSLIVFGIHLVLVGYLIARSSYIPKILGIALVLDGLAWIATELQPYLYPGVNVDGLFFVFFIELVFMLWLLIFGWRIREAPAS